MRVFIGIRSAAIISIPVLLASLGGTVDNDVEVGRTTLLLELEVGDLGEVTLAWLGAEGSMLDAIPLSLVNALIGPDDADRRTALLETGRHRQNCELARPVGSRLLAAGGDS